MSIDELLQEYNRKRREFEAVHLVDLTDTRRAEEKSWAFTSMMAAWRNLLDAIEYYQRAESWDRAYVSYGFDEERTIRYVGHRPVRPPSWVPYREGTEEGIRATGPAVVDEYAYSSRPVKGPRSHKVVFGPVVPRYGPRARLIGIGSEVTDAPEGYTAVCPEDGIEYRLTNIGGIFGSTLLWVTTSGPVEAASSAPEGGPFPVHG